MIVIYKYEQTVIYINYLPIISCLAKAYKITRIDISIFTLNDSSSSFFVQALDVTWFTNIQWGVNMALNKWKLWTIMNLTGKITILNV